MFPNASNHTKPARPQFFTGAFMYLQKLLPFIAHELGEFLNSDFAARRGQGVEIGLAHRRRRHRNPAADILTQHDPRH